MITPIFIPMNYRSGHFDISSVHHPIILLVFAVLPVLLDFLFLGLGLASIVIKNDKITNFFMEMTLTFLGLSTLGIVSWIIVELFSCI